MQNNMEELQNLLPLPPSGLCLLKTVFAMDAFSQYHPIHPIKANGPAGISDQALLNQQQFLPMIGSPLHSKSKFSSKIY